MRLIHRAEWGALTPGRMGSRTADDIIAVVVHYADLNAQADLPDEEAAVRGIQRYHMVNRGWSDIGYNALVGMSGIVYEGRGSMWVPAHCEGFNTPSLGLCFLTAGGISLEAGAAAVELVHLWEYLLHRKLVIFGHREKRPTVCPGDRIFGWVERVRAPGGALA